MVHQVMESPQFDASLGSIQGIGAFNLDQPIEVGGFAGGGKSSKETHHSQFEEWITMEHGRIDHSDAPTLCGMDIAGP